MIDRCTDTNNPRDCRTQEQCTTFNGSRGQNYYVEYHNRSETNDPQRISEPLCLPSSEVPDSGSMPLPVFTVEDLQRLDITPADSLVEPQPHTLINFHTNVYAQAQPQEFTTDLDGFPVQVRVHPKTYAWDYGDGTTFGPSPLSGYPRDNDEWDIPTDTNHVYTKTGTAQITLTTTYTGEYSIAGGPWLPVNGTASVPSPPVSLSIWRAKTRNYADNCLENPNGTGC